MGPTIRAAEAKDCSPILLLNAVVQVKHVAAAPWLFKDAALSEADFVDLIARADTVMQVAVIDDQIAGYTYAQMRRFPETPLTHGYRALHIHHICVDEAFRRQGIGRALVEAVREAGAGQGIARLTADVWDFNAAAKRLFERCGLSPYMVRLDQALRT